MTDNYKGLIIGGALILFALSPVLEIVMETDEERGGRHFERYGHTYKAWMKANPQQGLNFDEWLTLYKRDILPERHND